jgi:peptidoglycan/LPS O-acetylase OafA/YrhL
MKEQSLYLKNLNALRAIAAFMVVIHHTEQFKTHFNLPNLWSNSIIRELGGNAVSIFFVLSGFLISYLLLQEKKKKNTIALKKFYFRRMLRIWPLFFTLLILGIIANYFFGNIQLLKQNIFYFLFFIPNVLAAQSIIIPFIAHLWSIGVEEQFYVFWPLIALKTTKRNFLISMCVIIILFLISRNIIFHFYGKTFLLKLLNYTRFDMMAMGGIGALIIVNTNKTVTKIKLLVSKPVIQLLVITFFILYFFNLTSIYKIYFFENIFFGALTTLLLLVLVNENSILNLEIQFTKTLGDISYGVYMYHSIVIFFTLKTLTLTNLQQNTLLFNLILYPSVIILSSVTAYLSYHFIELRFLKLKEKYVVINSKPEQ